MIIIEDDKRILNLNHMAIYLMLTAEEMAEYKDKLKTLNSFRKLTRGIFRFEIVEKGDTPYEILPKEMTRAVTNCNVLVRLINSIHSIYCYGLDTIDLTLEERELRAELSSIVDDVCKKNIKQMEILCERHTGSSMQAVREYRANNIVKDTFVRALEGEIIPKEECPTDQMQTIADTADIKDSRELMQEAFTNPVSEKIERERCEREAPATIPSISVTIKNVPTGKFYMRTNRAIKKFGIEIIIDGNVVNVPITKIDQKMLFTAIVKAKMEERSLKRKDFTYDDSSSGDTSKTKKWKETQQWLQDVFKILSADSKFDKWFLYANAAGPAARINDAKSKMNKDLWNALSLQHKDAYYYCCIAKEGTHKEGTRYTIRVDKNNLHIDKTFLNRLD